MFTYIQLSYLGLCLEGFLFGLYSGLFAMLWQYHTSKEGTGGNTKWQNIIFYALCILYVLSAAVISLDIAIAVEDVLLTNDSVSLYRFGVCQIAAFACCDFITQSILIHRCWIMWGCNIRVVIMPSILAFVFLVMWIAQIGSQFIGPNGLADQTLWGNKLVLTGLTASMTVNALVTGLIVSKIFKVFRQAKSITTSDKQLSTPGERKIRAFIFIIIESGIALFAIQLARVVITIVGNSETWNGVFDIIVSIHEMLNGIVPTLTFLRVSMGLSFNDEPSFVGAVSASFQFAVDDPNRTPVRMRTIQVGSLNRPRSLHIGPDDPIPISELRNISQERRDAGEGDDIQTVFR